jgi:hypothetical protein
MPKKVIHGICKLFSGCVPLKYEKRNYSLFLILDNKPNTKNYGLEYARKCKVLLHTFSSEISIILYHLEIQRTVLDFEIKKDI